MKKIMVGDVEYFVEDEKYTAADFEKMEELQRAGDSLEVVAWCRSLVKKCLGEDIYNSIPMSEYPEVFGKAIAELLLPEGSSEKEKMIADIIYSFNKS